MADQDNFYASGISLAPAGAGSAGAASFQTAVSDEISVTCYTDELPPFVEAELERLYGQIFSSLIHFRAYGGLPPDTSAYVVRKNNRIVTIFLFLREGHRVRVINEGMRLDQDEVRRFADYMFANYPGVSAIAFHAVQADLRSLPFPSQCYPCTEDIVATVPDSREAYLAGLGKSTRSYIRRYENKLRRSFPSFDIKVYEKQDVDERDLRAIVEMNRARMTAKAKVSSNDDEELERIIRMVKECGVVCVATIDGRICAGVINYRLGPHFFMPVIAHDGQYDEYRLGTICCFLTVCECIARGCEEYHFMWGRYEYKYRLGGVQRDLYHLAVYRSRLHLLRNADMALKTAIDGRSRQAKQWLQDQLRSGGQGGLAPRMAFRLLNGLRSMKRLTSSTAAGQE